ncbi:MAG: DUF1579 domain-containing protein [Chloroflexi bacterium]|nr:DUF1579 domain-containing protein [Chloroflexota bacterium]
MSFIHTVMCAVEIHMGFEEHKLQGSPHHFLVQLAGAWTGNSLTWLDADEAPHESPVQGSIQLILDGRFALYLYQSVMNGEPQHGMFTFGYNTQLDRYESAWVDSFHNRTAIMYCTGEVLERGFSVAGSYPDPSGGPDWGWRTVVELIDRGHLRLTAYNLNPQGVESRAVETTLTRSTQTASV